MTYEYFKQVHSRNSWNNNNGALLSYVNANLVALGYGNDNNAFWDGSRMTYGRGTTWPPVVALDICAHEIGHGIFQSEVNYTSSTGEFGAINESLSDIWGACVENWATTNKQTWLIAEDLGFTLRNMSNPTLHGHPNTYGVGNWITADMHGRSTVMSHWFYLLSIGGSGTNGLGNTYNVTSIGIDKAAKIVYKAQTFYMTANTNFTNVRNYTIQVARELYGSNSVEVVSVTNAWHAVGVGARHSLILAGPTTVCLDSTATYIYSEPLIGTVTWSNSTNLTPVSGSPGMYIANGNGVGWVRIIVNGVERARRDVWVGTPQIISMTGNSYSYMDKVELYEIDVSHVALSNWIETKWEIFPDYSNGVEFISPTPHYAEIQFYLHGTRYLRASAINICGTGIMYEKGIQVCNCYEYHAYPNPASTILNIEIDPEAVAHAQSLEQTITDAKPLKIATTYDIRLYDMQGNLLRQQKTKGGTVQFNVAGLSNGIYILHIYDGMSSQPKMRQIVVDR